MGYPQISLKIGATHAGFPLATDGVILHQCNEDIALIAHDSGHDVINPYLDDVVSQGSRRGSVSDGRPCLPEVRAFGCSSVMTVKIII